MLGSYRVNHVAIIMVVLAAFAFAIFYLEGVLYLDPCPLCMVDRLLFAVLALLSLIALLAGRRQWLAGIIALLQGVVSLVGVAVAGRHIYLQNLPPDRVPECGPDLAFMLEAFPLGQVIIKVLSGSGQCADISWTFLGLTIPMQTLLLFLLLLVMSLIAYWRTGPAR